MTSTHSTATNGGAQYTLLLVYEPHIAEPWDFELVAQHVRELAPDIEAFAVPDGAPEWRRYDAAFSRPTMTFSPGPMRGARPPRGRVFQGRALKKSQEYEALQRVGVPVPRWTLLTPAGAPDLDAFDRYVVVKPDFGGRGADVKIKRKGRVRWSPPSTDLVRSMSARSCDWVVQEFVYTGPYPVSYRVTCLFGEPLWSWKVEAGCDRRALKHRHDFTGEGGGGMSVVSSGRGCRFSIVRDPELDALAAQAHRAFGDIPLIGVDLLRDCETGRLTVIEANSIGLTWHLTSPTGRSIQSDFDFDLDAQFDVRRHAARVLADRVRQHAV